LIEKSRRQQVKEEKELEEASLKMLRSMKRKVGLILDGGAISKLRVEGGVSKVQKKDQATIEGFRLSPQQARLWMLQQGIQSGPYTAQCSISIEGALDTRLLEAALNQVIQRHEILRTTFHRLPAMMLPLQVIAGAGKLTIQTADYSGWVAEEQTARLELLEREASQTPFDYERGPLVRAHLIKLGPERHMLLLLLPALCADRASLENLAREIGLCYAAYLNGAELPGAPAQYADLAEWQNELLESAETKAGRDYWRERSLAAPLEAPLPFENRRAEKNGAGPAPGEFTPISLPIVVKPNLAAQIEALASRRGTSIKIVLQACWQILLWRLTGEILIGVSYDGRNHDELRCALGLFERYLPTNCHLEENFTFVEVLSRLDESAREAQAWQECYAWEQTEGKGVPFFPLCYEYSELHAGNQAGAGAFSVLHVSACTDRFKLKLAALRRAGSLNLDFHYDPESLRHEDVERLAGHFQTMLERIVADPEQNISMLAPSPGQLLSTVKPADELDRLYADSNLTKNQLLIWTGQKLQPDVPLYNMVHTFTISGAVDANHFQNAFQTLLNSSDTLRTVIEEIDGVPQQRVIANSHYTAEYLDFSLVSQPQVALQAWTRHRSQVRFDLAQRLFDTVLIKISDQEYFWYLNVHHLITDGWSAALIFRRVSEFYERSRRGELEEKVELPSYQDYLDYEREFRSSARYRKVESYWKRKLAQTIEPISFYGKSPLKQTTRVERVSCDLGYERSQRLRALAAEKDIFMVTAETSLFNLFTAVLITYLYRVSGNRRLSLGIPFHNR
ncbi:MAG: hypothetical protein J2P31_09110, partial [Blastocatellia bacterium]|nr:hypothetical protein [Blastocatellia bacterium]